MAQWRPLRYETKMIAQQFGNGINTGVPAFDIKDNELIDVSNMSGHNYPAITTRYGRTFLSASLGTVSTPNGIGERNNTDLHIIDGNTWKYWDISSSAFIELTTQLSSTSASIQDFATGTARYTIMMNSTQMKYWDGTSSSLDLGDASTPYTKIFTVHKGRIFAARDNDIMYCAANDINDWSTANDAGSIDVTRSKGVITGLVEYNNHVIVFTEFGMHQLYGDSPSNFELVDIEGSAGCISHRSIVKCNKRLYWLSYDGIYEYNGASPVKVSSQVDKYVYGLNTTYKTNVVGGAIGDYLYMAIPYNEATSNDTILVYDTRPKKKNWFVETGSFVDFVTIQNTLYGIDSTGGVMNMRDTSAEDDNGTPITWSLVTKPFSDDTVSQKKSLRDISVVYKASASATVNASFTTNVNSAVFTSLAVSTDFNLTDAESNTKLVIPSTELQNIDWVSHKFNGTGQFSLYKLERNYRVKRK